jgi:uncharacterized protein (TIGR03435 family)
MIRFFGLFATGVLVAAQPSFEVASVKLTPPGGDGMFHMSSPGAANFNVTNITMENLISFAFGVDSDRVSGKQNWLGSESYDVSAKAEGGREIPADQLKLMLQQLLADRFKLSLHREMKDTQGYALVIAKDGQKLDPSKGGPSRGDILRGGLRLQNLSVQVLAGMLTCPTGRPVVDETGIKGNFDIKLEYAPEGATDSPLPSIFTALQEQLGLKLTPQKVPVEMLVVDHVERVPTEN